jgi:hypothetical protein
MTVSKLFLNGCSFLTFRPREGVNTHCGIEVAKQMGLELEVNLAGGGRGNKRLSFTTKLWCEKYPEKAKECFFLIGSSSGTRVDFPTKDGYKRHKFPSLSTTWKTYSPNKDAECQSFWKYLMKSGADVDQMVQIESLDNILNLQYYFEFKKYPYLIYHTISDPQIVNDDIKLLYSKINNKRFFRADSSHLDFVLENNLTISKDDVHPNIEGHTKWATLLKEFIDANNLRTI